MPKSATGLLQQWQFLPRDTPPGNHCIHQLKTNIQSKMMNTTTVILCREISKRELAIMPSICTSKIYNNCVKGAQLRYFKLSWPHKKLPLNGRKPENNSLRR